MSLKDRQQIGVNAFRDLDAVLVGEASDVAGVGRQPLRSGLA